MRILEKEQSPRERGRLYPRAALGAAVQGFALTGVPLISWDSAFFLTKTTGRGILAKNIGSEQATWARAPRR